MVMTWEEHFGMHIKNFRFGTGRVLPFALRHSALISADESRWVGKFGVADGRGESAELNNRAVHRGSMHWHWK